MFDHFSHSLTQIIPLEYSIFNTRTRGEVPGNDHEKTSKSCGHRLCLEREYTSCDEMIALKRVKQKMNLKNARWSCVCFEFEQIE